MEILSIILLIVVLGLGFTVFTGAPYVPSLKTEIHKAFTNLYPLSKKDLLIDLGSGDGVVLKVASEYSAKSIGIELNPFIAFISKIRLRKDPNSKIICKNFYSYVFPKETTVVYVFGDSRDIEKIYNKVKTEAKRLKKNIYIISNGFEIKNQKYQKKEGAYFLYKV